MNAGGFATLWTTHSSEHGNQNEENETYSDQDAPQYPFDTFRVQNPVSPTLLHNCTV